MKLIIKITDTEYNMLKAYAAAKRKYEVGKGFPVDKAIAEMVSIGLEAIAETTIIDKDGNFVQWNTCYEKNIEEEPERPIYKKY